MKKYGGTLIHRSRDEHGFIEVVDDDTTRSMHFGSEPKQSTMCLADPIRLELSYTRAMLASLLLTEAEPRRVLLIGLGGGSLAKFLLHHFPRCRIDVVEYRESVVKLARGYFSVPEDRRLRIVIDDGGHFIRSADLDRFGDYDAIFVDAYEAMGMSPSVSGISFLGACRSRMAEGGVFSINLWAGDVYRLEETLQDMIDAFGSVWRLPVAGKDNLIALSPLATLDRRRFKLLPERARVLEQQLDVEFGTFLRTLRKNNPLP